MERRDFLKFSGAALATLALGGPGVVLAGVIGQGEDPASLRIKHELRQYETNRPWIRGANQSAIPGGQVRVFGEGLLTQGVEVSSLGVYFVDTRANRATILLRPVESMKNARWSNNEINFEIKPEIYAPQKGFLVVGVNNKLSNYWPFEILRP